MAKFTNENIPREIIECCHWRPNDIPWYREGNVVYSKYRWLNEVFETEKEPFVLVTEEGDYSVWEQDTDFYTIRYTNGYPHGYIKSPPNHHIMKKWYSTNINFYRPGMRLLPFGTLKKHSDLLKEEPLKKPEDKNLLYINFSPYSSYKRIDLAKNSKQWAKFARITFPPQDGPAEEYEQYMLEYIYMTSLHKFIFCPEGSGIDTFRIWEAFSLGCIPILERSYFASYFDGVLPVLIVNDYREVTEDLLKKAYDDIMEKDWELERLTKKYWLDRIAEDANAV